MDVNNPLKMVLVGIDPYPCGYSSGLHFFLWPKKVYGQEAGPHLFALFLSEAPRPEEIAKLTTLW